MADAPSTSDTVQGEEPKEESTKKRLKIDEGQQNTSPPQDAPPRPVFGMGATGFGALSNTTSSWLKAPSGGGQQNGTSAAQTPGSGWLLKPTGDSKPSPFCFGQASSSAGFTLGGFGTSTTESTAGKKPVPFKFKATPFLNHSAGSETSSNSPTTTKPGGAREDGDDEGSEEGAAAFSEDIEAMPADKIYQRVELPEVSADSVRTGEEDEDMALSIGRGKLFVLVKKEGKKLTPPQEEAPAAAFGASWSSAHGSSSSLPASSAVNRAAAEDSSSPPCPVAPAPPVPVAASSLQSEWRESGVGTLRVLVPKQTEDSTEGSEGRGRVVMRREKTEALILNASLRGMKRGSAVLLPGDKAIRFSCFSTHGPEQTDESTKSGGSGEGKSTEPSRSTPAPEPLPEKEAEGGRAESATEKPGIGEGGLVAVTYLLKTKCKDEARAFHQALMKHTEQRTGE